MGPKQFMGRDFDGIHRMTFVIDEKGVISKVIDKVKTKDHAAQILEENLRFTLYLVVFFWYNQTNVGL